MPNEILYSGAMGAVIGSLITVFASLIIKFSYDLYCNYKHVKATKILLARAFWAEIAALFDLYEKVKMQPWEDINDSISFNMANIQYDYLSIFNNNTDKIGIFDSDDAAEFVKFYIFAKYYIDSLRELSRRWTIQSTRCETYTANHDNENLAMNCRSGLIDLFELYQLCYEQQTEFYHRRDEVKKTFDKYI